MNPATRSAPSGGERSISIGWNAPSACSTSTASRSSCAPARAPRRPGCSARYPGVLNTRSDGHVNPHGLRYTIGLAHPEFIELSERIDRAVIEHFAGHPGIAGWQVDNEVGGFNDCFCDRCLSSFQAYLRQKYGTVERLNQSWGAHFWSFNFSDFNEVPRPAPAPLFTNPQLVLEYRRFLSDLNVAFTRSRGEMIHRLDPGKFVTTNFQSFQAKHTDYFAMAETIDLPGMNHYPPRSPELILDYYRGECEARLRRGSVLVLEQLSRLAEWDTGEGWMRLWAYRALAHGACGTIFFRWRTGRFGQEQHADGILPHAGQENRRYRELARMGAELAQIGARIDATHVAADTAILMGYEGRWAMEASLKTANMQPDLDAVRFHNEFLRRNITTDVLDPHCDLSSYRLVIAPRMWLVDERIAANLRAFVQRGGVLCLTAASGVVDEFNVSFEAPRPGPLAEMAGLEVSDLSPLQHEFVLRSESIPGLDGAPASVMADEIHPGTAEVLAEYGEGWRKGLPALTRNHWGQGQVYYLGTVLVGVGLQALVDHLCGVTNIQPVLATPESVRAHLRVGQGFRLLFLLNQSEQPQSVVLPPGWRDAFSGEPCAEAALDPVGVRVLEQES